MHKVSIAFSRPRKFNLISKLIMLVEGTNYSHTFVSWKDHDIDRRKVFEAVGAGVRIIGAKIFKKKSLIIDIYHFQVDEETIRWLEQYSHDQSGKPYGYKHIMGLLIMRAYNFFGVKIANPYKDGHFSQICVEAGAYVIEKTENIDLPGDIEDYGLVEYKNFVKDHGVKLSDEKVREINGRV
jgi:hypothetical protein